MAQPKFEVIEEPDPSPKTDRSAAIEAIVLGLKTLSQKTLTALDNLFTLITVGLVFWLYHDTPDPNVYQIVTQGIFCAFVLAANVIVRRK
jgi:hypothetical protein